MKEIGVETVGLWKLYLETRLCEIMPYYNKLYETESKKYDYLTDVNLWENLDGNSNKNENNQYGEEEDTKTNRSDTADFIGSQTITGDTTGHTQTDGTTTTTDTSINSDYPQAHLSDTDYATAQVNSNSSGNNSDTTDSTTETSQKSDTTNNQTSSSDQTFNRTRNTKNDLTGTYDNHHVKHVAGLNGSRTYAQLIKEYRESLLNIDMMIINELSDLFMLIY